MNKFSGWLRQPSTANQEASGSSQNPASRLQGRSSIQLLTRQKENSNAKLNPLKTLKKRVGGQFQRIVAPLKSNTPATLPKADLNFVKRHSPLLDQQLASLDQTMSGASQYGPISAFLSEKALDTSKEPYYYLFQLAHLVGLNSDTHPISIKSRDEYIDSCLRRQAKGFQNEFKIRHDILARTDKDDPGKKFAAQFFSPGVKKLYDQLYSFNPPPTAQLSTHELARRIGELKITGGTTYAEQYGQGYDDFGISPEFAAANPKVIDYVEDYYNITNHILPSQELKLYAFDSNRSFRWLTTNTADAIADQQKDKLKSIGIEHADEFCKVISVALQSGAVKEISGRDNSWSEYNFNYKGVASRLYVQCGSQLGEILNVEIPEQSSNNTIHPDLSKAITGENYTDFQHLAAQMGMEPHALLTEVTQPRNYVRKSLEQKDTYIYRKKFNIDKAKNITITLVAQIKNQEIVGFHGRNIFNNLLIHFPKIEEAYARLEDTGWKITLYPGAVNFCDQYKKEICIADEYWRQHYFNSPETLLTTLAHEMAHAEYKIKPIFSREENLSEKSLDEGNSLFSEYILLEQIEDPSIKNRIINSLKSHRGQYFEEQYQVYEKWKNDKTNKLNQADQIAKEAFGNLYGQYQYAGSPTGVTYERIWNNWYEKSQPDGSQNPNSLIAELLQKNPTPRVWNKTARAWQPVASQNVSIIARLPKQTAEDKGKIIFFDKNAFLSIPQDDEIDPSRASFELVKTGLYHGNITFESDGDSKNTIAHLQFNQHGIDYHIQLNFDEAGYVSDWTVNESEVLNFGSMPPAKPGHS
ncbi:hypothetical protein [Mycoavidus sp. B2-EB]|uniref:hypothetical protein n=1 Tax=Mycoavidus sp. B2-EB TaxID=2651972 RepID=UPI00162A7737|nr:hypothetical protein [Mycoavidus sp. B2-EB]BBO60319.1 hypothetical protein MPB2EB_1459 [Mycoavidus sp. B2-EB]